MLQLGTIRMLWFYEGHLVPRAEAGIVAVDLSLAYDQGLWVGAGFGSV